MIPSTFPKSGPLTITRLLELTKLACDQLTPLITELYNSIETDQSDTVKLKDDRSVFTIADGLVQHMLQAHLFEGDFLKDIVGEEDGSVINVDRRPYSVDELTIPETLFDSIDSVREAIDGLHAKIDPNAYKDLTVFIDPIDGTREFSSGKGNECTILVGLVRDGLPVAGLVYKPLELGKPSWSAGCKEEELVVGELLMAKELNRTGFMVTNGSTSPFLNALADQLGMTFVRAGGAGNKMMALLEGRGMCYISDRGVSRWDTCAPQAVIEAHGGVLGRLDTFMMSKELVSYTYAKTAVNLDLTPGLPELSVINAKDKDKVKGLLESGKIVKVESADQVKPYANLCGLLALGPEMVPHLDNIHNACVEAAKTAEPKLN